LSQLLRQDQDGDRNRNMTIDDGVNRLYQIQKEQTDDLEVMHIYIDEVLVEFVPPEIREAYLKIKEEEGGFWYA